LLDGFKLFGGLLAEGKALERAFCARVHGLVGVCWQRGCALFVHPEITVVEDLFLLRLLRHVGFRRLLPKLEPSKGRGASRRHRVGLGCGAGAIVVYADHDIVAVLHLCHFDLRELLCLRLHLVGTKRSLFLKH